MIDLYAYEKELYSKDYNLIAGVDEAGRGPLCGPVVAASVILPKGFVLEGLTDSKQLSEKKLLAYFEYIKANALHVGVSIIDSKKIDEINIYEAARLAMLEAISQIPAEYVLVDAMPLPSLETPSLSIIKGDAKSISIAAASVIAKVTRDNYMIELGKKYPEYGFEKHKGYGTKVHMEAIKVHGVIDEHRRSFAPVRNAVVEQLKLF